MSSGSSRLPAAPPCPFCEGEETELMNAFGSHASVSTYWCRRCHSPFELLKWRGGGPPGPTRDAGSDPATSDSAADRATRS